MKRYLFPLLGGGVLGLTLAAGGVALRAGNPAPPAHADPTKRQIEAPVERLAAARPSETPAAAGPGFVNPKVQPGLVHWHASFEAACEAARRSGKPVLLFQMMGRLDQKFC